MLNKIRTTILLLISCFIFATNSFAGRFLVITEINPDDPLYLRNTIKDYGCLLLGKNLEFRKPIQYIKKNTKGEIINKKPLTIRNGGITLFNYLESRRGGVKKKLTLDPFKMLDSVYCVSGDGKTYVGTYNKMPAACFHDKIIMLNKLCEEEEKTEENKKCLLSYPSLNKIHKIVDYKKAFWRGFAYRCSKKGRYVLGWVRRDKRPMKLYLWDLVENKATNLQPILHRLFRNCFQHEYHWINNYFSWFNKRFKPGQEEKVPELFSAQIVGAGDDARILMTFPHFWVYYDFHREWVTFQPSIPAYIDNTSGFLYNNVLDMTYAGGRIILGGCMNEDKNFISMVYSSPGRVLNQIVISNFLTRQSCVLSIGNTETAKIHLSNKGNGIISISSNDREGVRSNYVFPCLQISGMQHFLSNHYKFRGLNNFQILTADRISDNGKVIVGTCRKANNQKKFVYLADFSSN